MIALVTSEMRRLRQEDGESPLTLSYIITLS